MTNPTQAQMPTEKELGLVESIRESIKHGYSCNVVLECIRDHVAEEVAKATAWQPLTDDTSGGKYLFGVWCDGKWYQAYGNLRVGGFLVPVGFRKYKNATHYIVPTPPTEQEV